MKKAKLKICVGYHKPSFLLNGDCFVPMWGGRAVANVASKDGAGLTADEQQWMSEHCIGDDTGDNISEKNRNYCEATYLYWMWKNYDKLGNPDYIGFLQYRRHWLLNDRYLEIHKPDFYNLVYNEYFSDDYQYKIGLTDNNIEKELENCDGIFCANDTGRTIEDYKAHHHSQDPKYWDLALEIIKRDWPQYADAAEKYNHGTWHAWSNCFIMKREDFLEYCPFLFDVLKKIDKSATAEYKNMTTEQMRVPAYVSETMLGIWWVYKQSQGRQFKTVPLTYIKKPFESLCSLPQHLAPVYKNAVPVVFIADENYVKYTSVAIHSLIQNSSSKNNYDIIILHDGRIKNETKQRIEQMQTKNVSIRFFNAQYYMQKYNFAEFFHRRLNLMPYLKLFVHEILNEYDRAIFLDGDILVLQDIATLYNLPLDGNLVAACQDTVAVYTNSDYWQFRRNYIKENNKMSDVNNFFNTGVLLMDLAGMRKEPELLNLFVNEARYKHNDRYYHDQDVFNFVCERKTKLLPQKYNLNYFLYFPQYKNKVPTDIQEEFDTDLQKNDICILHYNGDPKPWLLNTSKNWLADLWWKYARQTMYYEEFLQRMFGQSGPRVTQFVNISAMTRKYHFHRLLSHITFGKMHRKQKQCARMYHHLIRMAKK